MHRSARGIACCSPSRSTCGKRPLTGRDSSLLGAPSLRCGDLPGQEREFPRWPMAEALEGRTARQAPGTAGAPPHRIDPGAGRPAHTVQNVHDAVRNWRYGTAGDGEASGERRQTSTPWIGGLEGWSPLVTSGILSAGDQSNDDANGRRHAHRTASSRCHRGSRRPASSERGAWSGTSTLQLAGPFEPRGAGSKDPTD
jgi:hypothetical protein